VVEAVKSGGDLPPLTDLQQEWQDVTGITIVQLAIETDFRKHTVRLLEIARPALKLIVGEPDFQDPPATPDEIGTTRLGGDPDLPEAYPHTSDGRPFVFLGQFNVSDFAGTIVEDFFPETGVMSMFRTPTESTVGCFPTQEDEPKLVQYASDPSQLTRTARPKISSDEKDYPDQDRDGFDNEGNPPSVHLPYRPDLKFVETLSLPAHTTTDWLETEDDTWDFEEKLERDPFLLLGHVAHGNTGEDMIHEDPELVQLLRLPYMEGPDYGVTDCNLSILIAAADLRAGRLDRSKSSFG